VQSVCIINIREKNILDLYMQELGNFTLYRTGVITKYIRHQNTPIKERKNRQHTRHQILANSFIYLLIYLFTYLFIYLFTYSTLLEPQYKKKI
jgi:hypothetical protein